MAFTAGFPISILVVGGALLPFGGVPGIVVGGSNHRLVGGTVYIISCQHTNI